MENIDSRMGFVMRVPEALLRLALLHTVSPEVYYSISSVYGNVGASTLFAVFILVSEMVLERSQDKRD